MRIFAVRPIRPLAILLATLLALFSSLPTHAQSDRAALDGYLEAMTRLDFKQGATFFAEQDCRQFKALLKPILEMANGPEMRETAFRVFGELLLPAKFDALPPCALVADLLTRVFALSASLGAATSLASPSVLGAVPEGEDIRHYVVRSRATVGGEDVVNVQVVTVSRVEGAWRVRMSERLSGMASLMPRLLMQQKLAGASTPPAASPKAQ